MMAVMAVVDGDDYRCLVSEADYGEASYVVMEWMVEKKEKKGKGLSSGRES